jgi:hypothetical protein
MLSTALFGRGRLFLKRLTCLIAAFRLGEVEARLLLAADSG